MNKNYTKRFIIETRDESDSKRPKTLSNELIEQRDIEFQEFSEKCHTPKERINFLKKYFVDVVEEKIVNYIVLWNKHTILSSMKIPGEIRTLHLDDGIFGQGNTIKVWLFLIRLLQDDTCTVMVNYRGNWTPSQGNNLVWIEFEKALVKNKYLKRFNILGVKSDEDERFQFIYHGLFPKNKEVHTLEQLDFYISFVSEENINSLCKLLHSPKVVLKKLHFVATSLTNSNHNAIGDVLSKCNLESLWLMNGRNTNTLVPIFNGLCTSVKVLRTKGYIVDEKDMEILCRYLRGDNESKQCKLSTLGLSGCVIAEEAMSNLFWALRHNQSVKRLELVVNYMLSSNPSTQLEMEKMLEYNDTLIEIDMSSKTQDELLFKKVIEKKLQRNSKRIPTRTFGSKIKSVTSKLGDMNFTRDKFYVSQVRKNRCICYKCLFRDFKR
jgi:hypothetical protein